MILGAKRIDSTKGPIVRLIILYALPLILSSLIQSLFNAVDIVVLGNMADSAAVASVGATTTIVSLLVNSFIGLSGGSRIILAYQIGAQDRESVNKTVGTTLLTSVGLGCLIATAGTLLAPAFLNLTSCPAECYRGALLYLRIYVCAAPAVMIYNFGSAILNSAGDTQRPMLYILFCGLCNVILNVILCLVLPEKVAAVAIATAMSQVLGAFLVVNRLCRMEGLGKVTLSKLRWYASTFGHVMRYGVPIALSNALFPIANLQIQTAINSFGVSAIAGNSAAVTVEGISMTFNGAFATTTTTFIGQNLGAEKHDRVKRVFRLALMICVAFGIAMGVFMYATGRFWLGLILADDVAAIDYGMVRMFFVTLFVFVSGGNSVLSHALQGFGYSTFSAANSIVCVFGLRMVWMLFIYPMHPTFTRLMACFLVSWILMLAFNIIAFTAVYTRYKKGKLRRIA